MNRSKKSTIDALKLKASGFSDRAIEYYLDQSHMGTLEHPTVLIEHTGPCGDTIKLYLQFRNNIILDASSEVQGCAGAKTATSALIELIKGRSIQKAEKIAEKDIIQHLGGVPEDKKECVHLAVTTFHKVLEKYLAVHHVHG
jgi:nitrogen fixation NifU-like protein